MLFLCSATAYSLLSLSTHSKFSPALFVVSSCVFFCISKFPVLHHAFFLLLFSGFPVLHLRFLIFLLLYSAIFNFHSNILLLFPIFVSSIPGFPVLHLSFFFYFCIVYSKCPMSSQDYYSPVLYLISIFVFCILQCPCLFLYSTIPNAYFCILQFPMSTQD